MNRTLIRQRKNLWLIVKAADPVSVLKESLSSQLHSALQVLAKKRVLYLLLPLSLPVGKMGVEHTVEKHNSTVIGQYDNFALTDVKWADVI